jgi:hypothetical protein
MEGKAVLRREIIEKVLKYSSVKMESGGFTKEGGSQNSVLFNLPFGRSV